MSILQPTNLILILVLLCAGCLAVDDPTVVIPTLAFTAQISATTSPTVYRTATLKPSPTHLRVTDVVATAIPAVTLMPSPVSGAMSRTDLSQRIDDWINGDTPFEDADRLLDEMTGESLPLGLLVDGPLNVAIFISYHLGFSIVMDEEGTPYVLSVVGFEDGQGHRFAFPFHSGMFFEATCRSIHLQVFEGNQINRSLQLSFDRLFPEELLEREGEIAYRVTSITTWSQSRGWPDDTCQETEFNYYSSAGKTVEALIDYLKCENCGVADMPPTISEWINLVPSKFDPRIPYIRIFNAHK